MHEDADPLIRSFEVDGLFGHLRYKVEVPTVGGELSRLFLLHGDNGSGKTTLLRMLWHALSPAELEGHRTFLARAPFARFAIALSDGSEVVVEKTEGLRGSFTVTVRSPGSDVITARYDVDESLRVKGASRRTAKWSLSPMRGWEAESPPVVAAHVSDAGEAAYLSFLERVVKRPLFLADDRILYSDDPQINLTREALTRRDDSDGRDRLSRLVIVELNVALERVNDTLRSLTLGGQSQGAATSNAIYAELLDQFLLSQRDLAGQSEDVGESLRLLDQIQERRAGYENYGLVPPIDVPSFKSKIEQLSESALSPVVASVMSPFFSTLNARYEALRGAHDVLDALIPTINQFLRRKEIRFNPRDGLSIVTNYGERLTADSLSSGERQLLMLLCTTLLARVESRLFIIDEPELSLGVEWQRRVVDALLGVTAGSGVQFAIATHSIEVISGNPEALVALIER